MPKVALIGAGSVIFARNMLGDILSFPEFADAEVALMDIDPERLKIAEIMANKVGKALNVRPKVTAHSERRPALEGCDFVINMVQIGGFESTLNRSVCLPQPNKAICETKSLFSSQSNVFSVAPE